LGTPEFRTKIILNELTALPAPAEPAPVEPASVEPAPAEPAPAEPAPSTQPIPDFGER
jgi:hypothetical protein